MGLCIFKSWESSKLQKMCLCPNTSRYWGHHFLFYSYVWSENFTQSTPPHHTLYTRIWTLSLSYPAFFTQILSVVTFWQPNSDASLPQNRYPYHWPTHELCRGETTARIQSTVREYRTMSLQPTLGCSKRQCRVTAEFQDSTQLVPGCLWEFTVTLLWEISSEKYEEVAISNRDNTQNKGNFFVCFPVERRVWGRKIKIKNRNICSQTMHVLSDSPDISSLINHALFYNFAESKYWRTRQPSLCRNRDWMMQFSSWMRAAGVLGQGTDMLQMSDTLSVKNRGQAQARRAGCDILLRNDPRWFGAEAKIPP